MRVMYDRVAAIDVHKDMVKVAVRVPGTKRGTRKTDVLEFRTFLRGAPGDGWRALAGVASRTW